MLYLASQSPRRAELLRQIGVEFCIHPANVDETPLTDESPEAYVQRVAQDKAHAVFDQLAVLMMEPYQVLAADTSVVVDGQLLGKPQDAAEAQRMLQQLSGRQHDVFTAVALQNAQGLRTALSCSQVNFAPLSKACIAAYVATGEPFDKAGGYGIQGLAGMFVQTLHGSYSGVMGLPLYETANLLGLVGTKRNVGC